jgi:hypothetical protein
LAGRRPEVVDYGGYRSDDLCSHNDKGKQGQQKHGGQKSGKKQGALQNRALYTIRVCGGDGAESFFELSDRLHGGAIVDFDGLVNFLDAPSLLVQFFCTENRRGVFRKRFRDDLQRL